MAALTRYVKFRISVLDIHTRKQGKDQTENELDELERLERQLAARYNMAHAWGIDSVEVFGEAKARAFSERTPQSEQELRRMSELYTLRRQRVGSPRNRK